MSYGFGLERIGLLALRWPKAATAFILLLIIVALSTLSGLKFEQDINRVFLSQSDNSKNYRDFLERTGGPRKEIIIFAENAEPFSTDDYTRLRELALDLEFVDGVESVVSPFVLRFPKNDPDHPSQAVISLDTKALEIGQRLDRFKKRYKLPRSLISDDKQAALFGISILPETSPDQITKMIADVSALTKAATSWKLNFTVTGEPVIGQEIVTALQADLVKLNLLGALMVLGATFAIFRSPTLTAIAIGPALLGVLTCLSIFSLLNYPITVLSNVLPILVLGLGIASCLHLVSHWRNAVGSHEEKIEDTMKAIGPGCALASVTTMISFMAISITGNIQMFEFAVAGALSIAASFVVVIISFVLSIHFFGRRGSYAGQGDSRWTTFEKFETAFLQHANKIVAGACALLVLVVLGFANAQPWFSYEDNLPSHSALALTSDKLIERFGGFYRLTIELDTKSEGGFASSSNWQKLKNVQKELINVAPDNTILSIADIATVLGNPDRLPNKDELVNLPPDLVHNLISTDRKTARIVVFMTEPMRNDTTLAAFDIIEKTALAAGAQRVVGLPMIMRYESISIVEQLRLGLLFACIASVLIIALAFRSLKLIPILIVPNVLPMLTAGAAVHIFNDGYLVAATVLALTIAFAIAVDDTIHFTLQYKHLQNKGLSLDKALSGALYKSGRPMVLTTILLSIGMFVTLFSAFEPVQVFGKVLIVTFVTALLADLLLLPALLKLNWFKI